MNLFIIKIWISSSPRYHEYIKIIIYAFLGNGRFKAVSIVILCNRIIYFSLICFVMKIKFSFLCKHSSIWTSYIFDVKINYNSSLNVIILLWIIPCSNFIIRMLNIWKLIIEKTTMSYCGWSRNGSYKWSENYNLHAFFGWTVTDNFLFIWWISTIIIVSLCIQLSHLLIFI